MPAVTVTSTVLNEVEDIDGLVSTLAQQTLRPEVIIVDGGSTDGTWERLQAARAKYPNLIAIRDESCNLKASPGPIARGRNVGIAAATSEVVACADAGCIYDPGVAGPADRADPERQRRVRAGRIVRRSRTSRRSGTWLRRRSSD